MESLIDGEVAIRVSSTLDKSVGKKCLIDGSSDTCWTSQQGLPQWIQLTFPKEIIPKRILLTFQGGFVGTKCSIETAFASPSPIGEDTPKPKLSNFTYIYPEDANRMQTFDLPEVTQPVKQLRLVFETSSDFFGRITIYDLQIFGSYS